MASRRTVTTSSSGWRFTLVIVLFLLLLGGGITGTLFATGFFDSKTTVSREGQIAFPTLARPVSAYASISREDLLHPQTRQLNVTWIPETQVNPVMLRDLGKIIGRVVKRDKQPGYILTERDFMPAGTRPGISAGIPPGNPIDANREQLPLPGSDYFEPDDLEFFLRGSLTGHFAEDFRTPARTDIHQIKAFRRLEQELIIGQPGHSNGLLCPSVETKVHP